MKKWPRSKWAQAGIAFASSLVLAVLFGYLAERYYLAYYLRASPQSGWNSLGAAAAGFVFAFWTFPISFFLIFGIQWMVGGLRDAGEANRDTPAKLQ
jgi:hypothetical protein